MGKIIDLTNQVFGKLTVLEATEERRNRQVVWKCKCECGNITYVVSQALRTGHTKSCGCLNYDKKDLDSLLNKKFGKLTVIARSEKNNSNKVYWTCRCECGEKLEVLGKDLRNKSITSCSSCREKNYVWNDLSNQRFGLLTVIEPTEKREHSHIVWKCKCDCGNYCEVNSNSLKSGNTSSCGCLSNKSIGEEKIKKWLIINNIDFKRQYSFSDCVSPKKFPLLFDFAIINKEQKVNYLIEFDGIQHFQPIEYFGGIKYFNYLQACDQIKNNYCKKNNIKLLRISYKEINQIEEILNDNL